MHKTRSKAVYVMIIAVILASFLLSFQVPKTVKVDNTAIAGISSVNQYTFYTSNYKIYGLLKDRFEKYTNIQVVYTGKTPAQPQQPAPIKPQQPEQPIPAGQLTANERQMVDLVNKERASVGLNPLQVDMQLVKVARLKSQDMINNNYFAHQSPKYGSPFDMMKAEGISYRYAGENIAGASTVQRAHTSLMNSPGHRANIIKANYTHIGIGIVKGGPYGMMFSQEFIGK